MKVESELLVASWEAPTGSTGDLIHWIYDDGSESWTVGARTPNGSHGGRKDLTESQAQAIFDGLPGPHKVLMTLATIRG